MSSDSSSSSFDSSSLDTLVLAGSQAWLPLAALALRPLVDEEGAWAWEAGSIRGYFSSERVKEGQMQAIALS